MLKILFILMLLISAWPYKQGKTNDLPFSGVIMIDFGGDTINGQYYSGSKLSEDKKIIIDRSVEQYFSLWSVQITRSKSVFYSYPVNKRVRVVVTDDPLYYHSAFFTVEIGGITSTLNGIMLGDSIPCLVSTKIIVPIERTGDVIAHEIGHQLGLAHQSKWDRTTKTEEYNSGNPLVAHIMGMSVRARIAVWGTGINSFGLYQDDTAIISKTFKRIR